MFEIIDYLKDKINIEHTLKENIVKIQHHHLEKYCFITIEKISVSDLYQFSVGPYEENQRTFISADECIDLIKKFYVLKNVKIERLNSIKFITD